MNWSIAETYWNHSQDNVYYKTGDTVKWAENSPFKKELVISLIRSVAAFISTYNIAYYATKQFLFSSNAPLRRANCSNALVHWEFNEVLTKINDVLMSLKTNKNIPV